MTTDCTALDLPPGIGKPALRALDAVGIYTLAGVAQWTESELAALHGVGPKALGILTAALAARGQAFADEAER